jgi:hypothetical protein
LGCDVGLSGQSVPAHRAFASGTTLNLREVFG